MQFWHRQRAKRMTARVRCWANLKETKLLGFAGYKAGMTHLLILDNSLSHTKNEEIQMPVTVIECPPMKVIGIRLYKPDENGYGTRVAAQINTADFGKDVARVLRLPKKKKAESKVDELCDVKIVVATQPRLIGLKKTPEILELGVSGATADDKLNFAKSILGKEIFAKDVFNEGQQVDTHSVNTGKGYQGPVKRFGVDLRSHKSQKGQRGPANVGPWAGNRSWTVSHAGQMGFHQRMEHNKWIVKIGTNPAEINPKGGFLRYGLIRGNYVLVKGSVGGPQNRLITMTHTIRNNRNVPKTAPTITFTSLASKQ